MTVLLYLYLLCAAFAGGYMLKDSIDEREEGFVDPPPILAAVMLSMIAPIVVVSLLVHGFVTKAHGRIRR